MRQVQLALLPVLFIAFIFHRQGNSSEPRNVPIVHVRSQAAVFQCIVQCIVQCQEVLFPLACMLIDYIVD